MASCRPVYLQTMGLSYEVPLRSMYSTGAPRAGSSAADQQHPLTRVDSSLKQSKQLQQCRSAQDKGWHPSRPSQPPERANCMEMKVLNKHGGKA